MTTVAMQKDLVCDLKKEICSNIGVLSKLQPMSAELSRLIFKDNAMEKPTQHFFNHLSYYLVCIIDSHAFASLPWPLYDTKNERMYRYELFNFISDYSNKHLLSPVMSSYLINPGSYKVVMLVYQMSSLAIQRLLLTKMSKDRQKTLYKTMSEKYKSNETGGFLEEIDKETELLICKFSKYLHKHKVMERIADVLRNKIVEMDETLLSCNAQKYINGLIDRFIEEQPVDNTMKAEIQKIKNVSETSIILETWLTDLDDQLDEIEHKWDDKIESFLKICQDAQQCTQELIARHVGGTDKDTYMIEYNPKTDEICMKELQNHVNMEQKYVLKNIIRDGKLSFPYLVRGFLVAICFILKDAEIEDEIHKFNDYLESGKSNYNELVSAMGVLVDRVMNAEAKLMPSPVSFNQPFKPKQNLAIPPIPDLTDLRRIRNIHNQVIFDSLTPLNTSKHQFNLIRKKNISLLRQQSMLTTPFHHVLRDDFLKSIASCRVSSYNRQNISQNFDNMSVVSHSNRNNETISECATGFTKQQILRLLSTRKSSSSKKFKYNTERPDINIKKGGLFNESNTSNETNGLFRCFSSPNLYENRERLSVPKLRTRKLSIMQEDSPSHIEVSGIVPLETDNSYGTAQSLGSSASVAATSLPFIVITPVSEKNINNVLIDTENDINTDTAMSARDLIGDDDVKTETPKNNPQLIRKTSSLEKIINRFKKVRANVLPSEDVERADKDFKTIVEEKEAMKTVNVDVFTVNRILLPDLLSPSCSGLSQESTDYLDQICYNLDDKVRKKPRESLGAALGVDQTFLDQFDLID